MTVGDWVDAVALGAILGLTGVAAHASGLTDNPVAVPILTVVGGLTVVLPAMTGERSPMAPLAVRPWVVAPVALTPAAAVILLTRAADPPHLLASVLLGLVAVVSTVARFQMLVSHDTWRAEREADLVALSAHLVGVDTPKQAQDAALDALVRMTGGATVALVDSTSLERLAIRNADRPGTVRSRAATSSTMSVDLTALQPPLQLVVTQNRPIVQQLDYWIEAVADHLEKAILATDHRRRESDRRADERFQALAQDSNDLVALIDPETLLVRFIGPTLHRLLGYEAESYIGAPLLQHVAIDDLKAARQTLRRAAERRKGSRCDVRLKAADGSYRWFSISARRLGIGERNASGEPTSDGAPLAGVLVNLTDIHERKMAEFLVRRAESRYRALVEKSTDVFALVARDLTIDYISPNVKQLIGYEHIDLLGGPFLTLLAPTSADGLLEITRNPSAAADGAVFDVDLLTASGAQLPAQLSVHQPDPAEHGGLLLIMRDVSARRRLEENLRSRNLFDQLTGLMTRAAFEVELRRSVERLGSSLFDTGEATPDIVAAQAAAGLAPTIGVLALDIRAFKEVNNWAGFEAGNDLLVQVAKRLTDTVRGEDQVARLAVDEFAVLAQGQNDQHLQEIAERIRSHFATPFSINGRSWKVDLAMGLATTNVVGNDATQLLQAANLAQHQAKQQDPATIVVYSREMKEEADERFELLSDMGAAVDDGDFYVAYQPLISLRTQGVTGFEALLRWAHPNRGNISPVTFIPLAERSGMIIDLGRWVMGQSCRQLNEWRSRYRGYEQTTVAVNMSARQLEGPGELDNLIHIIEGTGLDFTALTVELTESVVIEDAAGFRSQLDQLRQLGVRIAIDDFGTGASGLNHLREFPFDIVKIDRSYTKRVGVDDEGEHLVGQLIELSKGLNAVSVAEGIESQLQADKLARMGCDIGQGFHLAKPMEAKRIVPWMQARREGIITS